MLETRTSVVDIVNHVRKHPSKHSVYNDVNTLVDLMLTLTDDQGVELTCEFLTRQLLRIRTKLTRDIEFSKELHHQMEKYIEERITIQLDAINPNTPVEMAMIHGYDTYIKISSSIISNYTKKFPNHIAYDTSRGLLAQINIELLELLQSSLLLENAMIMAELILSGELKISKPEQKKLAKLIKDSVEDYGIFANALELWTPDFEDEAQWIRNIKIRIAVLDNSENKRFESGEEAVEYLKSIC